MGRLNQVIAVSEPAKTRMIKTLEEAHRNWKSDQIAGLNRSYAPNNDDGETLPGETKIVQTRVFDVLKKVETDLVALYDIVATQDTANTLAKTEVEVDGRVVAKDVPVTVLLFLEKQLATNIIPFIRKLPTLPSDRAWKRDEARNCFVSDPVLTNRTKKVPQTHIKYEATEHHPAQTEMYYEDVSVGTWTTTHFSGAILASVKAEMLERAEKLQNALKKAREEANSMEAKPIKMGQTIWNFVFGKDN